MPKTITITLFICLLLACSSNQRIQKTNNEIDALQQSSAKHWNTDIDLPHVIKTDEFYVEPLRSEDVAKPGWWFNPVPSLRVNQLPLKEIMAQLSVDYGASVSYHSDVDANLAVSLQHTGSLGEIMDKLSLASGYSYALKGNTLVWEKFTSRVFDISFLPGISSYLLGRQGGAQSQLTDVTSLSAQDQSYSGGSPLQSMEPQLIGKETDEYSSMQGALSVWQDLEQTLGALKGDQGQVTVSQATTAVFVRDLPEHVEAMAAYINRLNEQLTRQVAVDVQIIEVRMNKGFDYGLNWNLIKKAMGGDSLVSFLTDFSQNQLTNFAPALLSYEVLSNTSDFAGSSLLFNALEQQGQVSVVTSPRVVTLNNQIAEIAITDQQTYLAASTTRSTINVGSDTTLIPGIVSSGLKLFVLPKINRENVLLQISGNLSSLTSIDRVESNNSAIETPSLNDKRIFQRAMVPFGKTLMLAGLKNVRNETGQSGLFGQQWLGGNKGMAQQMNEVIVLITPHRIDGGGGMQ